MDQRARTVHHLIIDLWVPIKRFVCPKHFAGTIVSNAPGRNAYSQDHLKSKLITTVYISIFFLEQKFEYFQIREVDCATVHEQ